MPNLVWYVVVDVGGSVDTLATRKRKELGEGGDFSFYVAAETQCEMK